MPWRTIQDEFGKFKWVDHAGRIYHGTPFSVEPDVTSKHVFIASMMHTSFRSPELQDKPDHQTFPDSEKRKEVVHHEQILDYDVSKSKKNTPDKKFQCCDQSQEHSGHTEGCGILSGSMRERWLISIYKEIENFLQNMAIEDANPSLVVRWKSSGRWPLPCQMVFVLKPFTQSQQDRLDDVQAEYKHKSRLVICGNFASWGEHSTTTTNLDAPLLRLTLSLSCSIETTWSSIDITSAFLNADIHDDDTVLVTPPANPSQDGHCEAQRCAVWHVKKAIYGLREAPRLWQQERDQKLRDLEFKYKDKLAHLVQSYIHSSLWFIAEGPKASTPGVPPFDHCLRSDEWTARLHDHSLSPNSGMQKGQSNIRGLNFEVLNLEALHALGLSKHMGSCNQTMRK